MDLSRVYKDYYFDEEQVALSTVLIQGPNIGGYKVGYTLVGEGLEQVEENGDNGDIIASVSSKDINYLYTAGNMRSIMLGELNADPCSYYKGEVFNTNCSSINNKFIYSGNPIKQDGWVNTRQGEKALLLTTDSFSLEEGKPIEIIYAFVLGTDDD